MATRSVSVELRAKVDNYVSGMKKASAATKAAMDTAEKNRKEMALMGKAAALVGGVVVAQFARKIISAASDLNETVSKSTVVFGKNAAAVQAWAKTSAKAFGMSENAALGAASTYGNLFVSLGMTEDASAKMSTKLVELAGDLASFNNVSPEEALDALRSGLVGETEPLKRFGVNMNEATLKAQAMKMGLISTTKEALDPAVKAQAAYALILEQSTTAQGDFARTSDGLANQQRILNAEWENAQASLGQTLLPAMTDAVSVLNDMLAAFNALPQPVKSTALGIAAVSAALLVALPRIVATKAALSDLGVSGKGAAKGLAAVAAAAVALEAFKMGADSLREWAGYTSKDAETAASALNGLTSSADLSAEAIEALGVRGLDLRDAMDQTFNRSAWMNLANFPNVTDHLGISEDVVDEWARFAESADAGLSAIVSKGGPAADAAQTFFKDLVRQMSEAGATEEEIREQFPLMASAAASASAVAASGLSKVGDAADGTKKEVVDLETALASLRGEAQSVAEANAGLEQSFDDAREAAAEMKGGLNKTRTAFDLNTEAGRNGQEALFGIIDAAYDTAEAMATAGASTKTIRDRTMDARIEFIKTAEKMGLTKDAAKALADKYELIPQRVATKVAVNRAEALAAIEAVKSAIRTIPRVRNVKVKIETSEHGTGGGRTVFASGGSVRGPGSGTSDSVPARLSNGEYVVKARSVRKYGTRMLGAINEGRYAVGGAVGPSSGVGSTLTTTGTTSRGGFFPGQITLGGGAPIVINVDGVQVWRSLLTVKRSRGGASLGLD